MPANVSSKSKVLGFTLIELVIGIITFSIVMTIIIGLIAPQASRSADPIMQVRATELAQSMFNEILGKSFDENSDRVGGRIRCDEDLNKDGDTDSDPGEIACTGFGNLGPDSEVRATFDDVDDYHNLTGFSDTLGTSLANQYDGYSVQVTVGYDGDMDGILNENTTLDEKRAKRIQITITTPNQERLVFAAYRSNF